MNEEQAIDTLIDATQKSGITTHDIAKALLALPPQPMKGRISEAWSPSIDDQVQICIHLT